MEVFRSIRAETCNISDGSDFLAPVLCSNGLGSVFHDKKAVFICDSLYLVHLRRLSVKVDRFNSHCPWGYALFDEVRIDIEGFRINIDKYRRTTAIEYRIGRRREAKRCCNNLIAGPDA